MLNSIATLTIDTIQDSKKQFVNTFVVGTKMREALNDFVDIQTDYTKKAVNASIDSFIVVSSILTSKEYYGDLAKLFTPVKTK